MSPRVLVVARRPAARVRLARLLESGGYAVAVAPDGRTALGAVEETAPALVIAAAPLADGALADFCRALRRRFSPKKLGLLALLPPQGPDTPAQVLAAGADWFIGRPYQAAHLLATARTLSDADARAVHLAGDRRQVLRLLAGTAAQVGTSRQALSRASARLREDEEAFEARVAARTQTLRRALEELQSTREQALLYAREFNALLQAERKRSAELKQALEELQLTRQQSVVYARDFRGAFAAERRRTEDLRAAMRELEESYDATIAALSAALDSRDRETEGHARRVTAYTLAIARAMGVPDGEIVHIERGAYLHDIGKIGIPDAILLKPGALTPEEWTLMRRHPDLGYQMISGIAFLVPAAPIVLHHHERYDGGGYPLGLSGEDIPIGARAFAIADTFDAVTSDRPYRPSRDPEAACAEIRSCAGSQFDPNAVQAFLRVYAESDLFRTRGATAELTLRGLKAR